MKKPLKEYWYPRTPTKWRRKTTHLSPAAEGLYLRLTDHYMETKEALPDNDASLARICGISPDDFAPHAPILRGFYIAQKGLLFNKTCEENLDAENGGAQKRSKAASKAAIAKWEKKRAKSMHDMRGAYDADIKSMPENATEENRREEKRREEVLNTVLTGKSAVSDKTANASGGAPVPKENFDEAVELFNAMAERAGLAKCQKLSDGRRKSLKSRLKECGGIEGWKTALEKVAASTFLTGGTERPFHASFDFLINPTKFTRLMEGAYDNRKSSHNPKQSAHDALAAGFDNAFDYLEMEKHGGGGK